LSARSSSRPLVPGIIRSVSTTCTGVLRARRRAPRFASVGREDAHAVALEDLLERRDVARLVVDDEHGGASGAAAGGSVMGLV
jgi:hypothetical protein